MKEIIIYQPWGGLGDNLGHSPVPEMCHNLGIKCYLSNQNVYRNPEIYDIVWANNPYLAGKKDSTDMSWLDKSITRESNRDWNELKNIQSRYGLIPSCHYPKIYYQPKLIDELKDASVINISGYSIYVYENFNKSIKLDIYNILLERLIETYKFENLIKLTHSVNYAVMPTLPAIEKITNEYKIKSLQHYADIMYSCKNYICFNSGPSILAAAIKDKFKTNSNIFVFNLEELTPPTNYNCYVFKNANYITIDTCRMLSSE